MELNQAVRPAPRPQVTKQSSFMIVAIDNVLASNELQLLLTELQGAEFVDGQLTAGRYARTVKNNLQLATGSTVANQLQAIVQKAVQRHPLFQAMARPQVIRVPLFSRYEPGMSYGLHTDNAMMNDPPLRSDLSLTLFLTEPESYEGGELAIDTGMGEQYFKLAAGSMVVYPSTHLHRVTEVTQGIRFAAVTWVQSYVRDAAQREILFDLDTVRQSLFRNSGKTIEFDLLCKTHSNLLRRWIEL
jgi:PKHD-type hydroxylase